ncbi:MAG: hypothetical protein ACFCGT_15480 [Sandaracinaceae bacterium]
MLQGSGSTPAERRAALLRASTEDIAGDLVEGCLRLRQRRGAVDDWAQAAGLPLGEVLASPFGLRAVGLALEVGSTTLPVEVRRRLAWHPDLVGDDAVRDPDHGVWDRGRLGAGKYEAFLQDEPFAAYDPGHHPKWGPHELLHRAAGFFHRRGMSRWELYLGARLNELVPVVAWYGPEQALRGAEEQRFDRARPWDAEGPGAWWTASEGQLLARARRAAARVREGVLHFEREWAALDEELRTDLRVPVRLSPCGPGGPLLDASSDATAYVVGHYRRLTHPAVCTVLEGLAELRLTDVGAYRDHVETLFDRLLFGALEVDLAAREPRRFARHLADLALRAVLAAPTSDPERLVARLRQVGEAHGPSMDEPAHRAAGDAVGRSLSTPRAAPDVVAWGPPAAPDIEQLLEGVSSVAPALSRRLGRDGVAAFAASPAFLARRPLTDRLATFLASRDGHEADRDLLGYEVALAHAARDDGIERLTVPPEELPEDLDGGMVIRSRGARLLRFGMDVLTLRDGLLAGAGDAAAMPGPEGEPASLELQGSAPTAAVVVGVAEGAAVVEAPPNVERAFEALEAGAQPYPLVRSLLEPEPDEVEEGWPTDGEAWALELFAARVLGWRPRRG